MGPHAMKSALRLLAAAAVLSPMTAHAHHPVSEAGAAWVEPSGYVETAVDAAAFDFGAREQGHWQVLTTRAEVPILEQWSVSASIPIAYLRFTDGRGAVGLSDIELSTRVLLHASQHGGFIASAVVGTTLPTGEPNDALGAGHFEAMGALLVSSQLTSSLNVYASVAYKNAIGDSLTASQALFPHNNREFETMQGAQWFWWPEFWTELTSRQIVSWEDSWGNLLEAGIRTGLKTSNTTRASVSVWAPVSGSARTEWRTNLSWAWMF
ncbi:MAG: hypothetical protein R3E66_14660 [bacterium]